MSGNQWVAAIIAVGCIIALYTRMDQNQNGSRDAEKDVTRNQVVLHAYIKPETVSSFSPQQRARLAGWAAGAANTLAADGSAQAPIVSTDYQATQIVVRASSAALGDSVPTQLLAPLAAELKPLILERVGGDAELSSDERSKLVDLLRAVAAQFGGG